MIRCLYQPWVEKGRFRFTDDYVLRTWNAMLLDNPNRSRLTLPKDWVFVNRLQWGLFSVLARLDAESDWSAILLPMIADGTGQNPEYS